MTVVITAPVVYGDGDIAKIRIDSFKEDLQKEEGLSPEERQRYNELYNEFVNNLSVKLKKAQNNWKPKKIIEKLEYILSKRMKALEELSTWRKISLLKMYERWLNKVSFNNNLTKDWLCRELISLQRLINENIHYSLNWWNLVDDRNIKKVALNINNHVGAKVITDEEIKAMWALDETVLLRKETELAEKETKLAEKETKLAEKETKLAISKEINKRIESLSRVL